ncbi:hypothetical protein GE061_015738 [Apolygus lucorum]|uniref:Peptidase S1 domain-containing protein n=1 Tax=Apolygus lucorum TaxID=248454 RepID=A0A8S9XM15_APOLU|nr:hypothetical protein GE061_015738 [Apolygus lucorum]
MQFVMITGLPRISDYQKIDVKLENFQAQEEKPVGTGNLRIAKGQDAKEGEFPYVVALLRNYHKTRNYHEHRGSGTLVTNAHVLTACHLLVNEDGTVKIDVNLLAKPSDIGIMAGTVDWNNTAESIRVYGHELKVHPLCARTHTSLVYDFGLVLLERALELKQGRIEALKFPDYSCITLVNSLVYELAECVIMEAERGLLLTQELS